MNDKDHFSSGREDAQSDHFGESIDDLNQALHANPNSAEAYFKRGNVYTEFGDYQKAINDYDLSIAINPEVASPYFNRGNAYYRLGQFEKAIEDYTAAIDIDPQLPEAYCNRGLTFYRMHKKKMALPDFQTAAALLDNRGQRESCFLALQFVLLLDPEIIKRRLQAEAIRPAPLNIRISKERIHLNFEAMSKTHPASLLKLLIRERANSIVSHARSVQAIPAESLTLDSFEDPFTPINPLLLVTAISCSIVRNQDFCFFLSRYVKGRDVSGLEAQLLQLPAFDNEEALARFLALEEAYVEALRSIVVEDIIYLSGGEQLIFESSFGGGDPTSIIEQYWQAINSNDNPEDWDFSAYNVMWRAWILASPALLILTPKCLEARLSEYGFQINDDIHTARKYYEENLMNVNRQINVLLQSSLPKETKILELRNFKQSQLNAQKLVNRAFRLYEWNPAEITADYMGASIKNIVSDILDDILPDGEDEEVQ